MNEKDMAGDTRQGVDVHMKKRKTYVLVVHTEDVIDETARNIPNMSSPAQNV